mmetsp:Transcript_16505/g.14409  ORF Transcript_16505/g.14409 Transcript_16505/m.14409 type:complete len:253 (+) Transcript_16505:201-959(+)
MMKKNTNNKKSNRRVSLVNNENADINIVRNTYKPKQNAKTSNVAKNYKFNPKFQESSLLANSNYFKNQNFITVDHYSKSMNFLSKELNSLKNKLRQFGMISKRKTKNKRGRKTKKSPKPKNTKKLMPCFKIIKRSRSPEFKKAKDLNKYLQKQRLMMDKLKSIKTNRRRSTEIGNKSPNSKKSSKKNTKGSPFAQKSPIRLTSPFFNKKRKISGKSPKIITPSVLNYNVKGLNKDKSMTIFLRLNVNFIDEK